MSLGLPFQEHASLVLLKIHLPRLFSVAAGVCFKDKGHRVASQFPDRTIHTIVDGLGIVTEPNCWRTSETARRGVIIA
jgi:hypothetical protein